LPTEGNLQAPTRHPLDWKNPEFYDPGEESSPRKNGSSRSVTGAGVA
jgi:hypothetical protein